MMRPSNTILVHSVLCLLLLILQSCTNSAIPPSEIETPSPTLTHSITPSPSITPTSSIAPTASITPGSIIKLRLHTLALNENNISKIRNLATFGTPSNSCLISSSLDSAVETRFINDQTEYLLASKDFESQKIQVWNLETKKMIQSFDDVNADTVLFAPDHNTLISFSRYEPGTLTLWDTQSGNQRQKFEFKPNYYYDERINLSPDGLTIALFSAPYNSGSLQVSEFNLQTNQITDTDYELPVYYETPAPHIYSPKGNLVAVTYNNDNQLHFLNLTTHSDTILQFPYSHDQVFSSQAIISTIAIDSKEKYIVGGALNGNIYIWDLVDGSLIRSFKAHETSISDGWIGGVKILEFSPESNLLLSVGYDGFTKLWDANAGVLLKSIHTCYHFGGFTQDGRYLVTVGKKGIELWGIP